MSTYAIGDIQGCYDELMKLLEKVNFQPSSDRLLFVGDLVNRGPASLKVLQFVKNLKDKQVTVLGNHDLHFIAVALGCRELSPRDTIQDILSSPDREELAFWLLHQQLLHHDLESNCVLVHAGIYPKWDLAFAQARAKEVEEALHSDRYHEILPQLFDDHPPLCWDDKLTGNKRYNFIVNTFVLMRYCDGHGYLDFDEKGFDKNHPLFPWFKMPGRTPIPSKILFGHWAALGGKTDMPDVIGLDTGCVWGHELTALRLEDGRRFSVTKL